MAAELARPLEDALGSDDVLQRRVAPREGERREQCGDERELAPGRSSVLTGRPGDAPAGCRAGCVRIEGRQRDRAWWQAPGRPGGDPPCKHTMVTTAIRRDAAPSRRRSAARTTAGGAPAGPMRVRHRSARGASARRDPAGSARARRTSRRVATRAPAGRGCASAREVPKVHGAILSVCSTRLTSAPSRGVAMVTTSPMACVKPCPGPWRSCTGANMVPQKSTKPSGYWWCGPMACATRSSGSRLIFAIELAPSSAKPSSPSTRSRISQRAHVVDAEAAVEQAQERPDRAGRVVVLRLAEQQRAAALEVAQVDVVAQRRAPHGAAAVDEQHDLRLRVVPGRLRDGCRSRRPCRPTTSAAPW